MPARIFSTATHSISIGASRRSSISLLNWNSEMSGMATAWMPDRNIESAMMPGRSRLLYCSGM